MKRHVMAKAGRDSLRRKRFKNAGARQLSVSARRAERARVALHEATDGRAFAKAVFRLMLARVPADYASAQFHCSPSPKWGAWLASNGMTISPELMEEIGKVHLGIPTLLANPGITVIPTRGVLPPEEVLVQTPFYRIFMQPYKWRHAVAIFCWQSVYPPVVDCVFSVHRTAEQGDFSEEEIAKLAALHPEIDRARLRVARLEEERGALKSLQHFVRDLPVPAVLLNGQSELLYHNREAVECCARWMNGNAVARALKPSYHLPPALQTECVAMKAQWDARRGTREQPRGLHKHTIHHPTTPGLTASISIIESGLVGDPNFLIVFEQPVRGKSKLPPTRDKTLAELSKLTPRQREIATLAVEGKSNEEIATALGCNIGTIKSGLHAVFKKTGVASRAQLIRKIAAP